MKHPRIIGFDINGNPIELTGEASAAYHAYQYQLDEVAMNLARFGANEIHGIHHKLGTYHTRIASYKDGTPCIIQSYALDKRLIYLGVLFNPLKELLDLGADALNDRELVYEASKAKDNPIAEAYCKTVFGDLSNYPCNIWGAGGQPMALARIKACPTEITYEKVKKKIRGPFYRPDGYFEL